MVTLTLPKLHAKRLLSPSAEHARHSNQTKRDLEKHSLDLALARESLIWSSDSELPPKSRRPRSLSPSSQTRWWSSRRPLKSHCLNQIALRREKLAKAVERARLARLEWEEEAGDVIDVDVNTAGGIDGMQEQEDLQYARWKKAEAYAKIQRRKYRDEKKKEAERKKKDRDMREAILKRDQLRAEEQRAWQAEREALDPENGDYRRLVGQLQDFLLNPTVTPFPVMEKRYGYTRCYKSFCVRAEKLGVCQHGLERCLVGSGVYGVRWLRREREGVWNERNFEGEGWEMVDARVRVREMRELMRVLLEGK